MTNIISKSKKTILGCKKFERLARILKEVILINQ